MPRLRRSALESDLACPELLIDDAEMMDYWSACGERTQSDAEEVLSAPNPCANYSLILLLDLSRCLHEKVSRFHVVSLKFV
jgi:hypothetical protein